MARGRILSRTLGSSRRFYDLHVKLAPLSLGEFAGEFYCLMVAHHDDHGRLDGDAFTVKNKVHPASVRTLDDFETALNAMHDARLIIRYTCRRTGAAAIQVVGHEKHQDLDSRQQSQFSPPPITGEVVTVEGVLADAIRCALTSVTGSPVVPTRAIAECSAGALTDTAVAALLSKYGLYPGQVRVGLSRVRGFDPGELEALVTGATRVVTTVTTEEKRREEEQKRTEMKEGSAEIADPARLFDDVDDAVDADFGDHEPEASTKPGAGKAERATSLAELWHRVAPSLPRVTLPLTAKRVTAYSAALKRNKSLGQWQAHFERIERSSFCKGTNDRQWKADLDWAITESVVAKTGEGKYDDKKTIGRPIKTAADARAVVRERGLDALAGEKLNIV